MLAGNPGIDALARGSRSENRADDAIEAARDSPAVTASALSNVRWVALSQAGRVAAQLASITVLVRLLPPAAYGLIAMAAVVTNLAYLGRDFGTAAALIQRETLSESAKSTTFWLNMAVGVTLFILILASAPLVAAYFREPELVPVLWLLALVFPLSGSTIAHQALMERESRFRSVALIEVCSTFVGFCVALAAAWSGAGVFSLVFQVLTVALLSSAALWRMSGWRPRFRCCRAELATIMRFSGNFSLANVASYVSRNADGFVIGRVLGSVPLGIYSVAYRIMLFPVQNMTFVASRALYPVLARLQNEPLAAGRSYKRALALIAFLSAPLMAGLFALREQFVAVIFGPPWVAVAGMLAWLAPIGFIQSIVSSSGVVFLSFGRARTMMLLGVASALMQVAAFCFGVHFGLPGVAACYLLATILSAIPTLWFVSRLAGIGIFEMYREVLVSALCATAMMLLVVIVDDGAVIRDAPPLLRLTSGIGVGAAVYAALSWVFMRAQCRSMWALVSR